MIKILKKNNNVEEITPNTDPLTKLSKDIKKKMITKIINTSADAIAMIVTPIVLKRTVDNIEDKYARKAILIAGATILAYQTNTIIDDILEVKLSVNAYKTAVKMTNTIFEEDPLGNDTIIELNSSQWSVSQDIFPDETIVSDETNNVNPIEKKIPKENSNMFEMVLDQDEDDDYGDILFFVRAGEDEPDIDELE